MSFKSSVFLRVTRGFAGELICEVEDCVGPVDESLLADAEAAARMIEGMHDCTSSEERPRLTI